MARQTILIVEDDEDIQQLVSYNLLRSGFTVECADSGEQALALVKSKRPDLVILDIMLPGIDGLEVCRTLCDNPLFKKIPIIILTAKGEEEDIVTGLDLGADDYITKPFSPKVLISRIKSVLRRQAQETNDDAMEVEILRVWNLVIDIGRHQVTVAGRPVNLTPTEFGIIEVLAKKPGWVFTRQQLIDAVRGYDYLITPRAMDVQVFSLRKKLGETGKMIETVRGVGYRFKENT